jgi:hypothetical protein
VLFESPLRHLFTMRRLKRIAAGTLCSLLLLVVYLLLP